MTIAFHCEDVSAAAATASEAGVAIKRESEGPTGTEVDFEAWAGVQVRLVQKVRVMCRELAIDLMTHAIQEMGYLVDFLPGLYATGFELLASGE